jgi:hypothetical protein
MPSPNIEKADQWYKLNSHILKKYRDQMYVVV